MFADVRSRFWSLVLCLAPGLVFADTAAVVQTLRTGKVGAAELAGDHFGDAVAIDGDVLVAGARDARLAGQSSGAAYVYVRRGSAWSLVQTLADEGATAEEGFGSAVAVLGDTIFVGAPRAARGGIGAGAMHVYVRAAGTDRWDPAQVVDGVAGDAFGTALAVSGDTLYVGAPSMKSGNGRIASYRNVGGTWTPQGDTVVDGEHYLGRVLEAADDYVVAGGSSVVQIYRREATGLVFERRFFTYGFSPTLALDGNTLVIGDPEFNGPMGMTGRIEIFQRAAAPMNWVPISGHTDRGLDGSHGFGAAVALSGDRLLVAALGPDERAVVVEHQRDAGGANRWDSVQHFDVSGRFVDTGAEPGRFALAARGDTFAVGRGFGDGDAPNAGDVRVYAANAGGPLEPQDELRRDETNGAGDAYGHALARSGDWLFVGSPFDDRNAHAGAVYVYRASGDPRAPWIPHQVIEPATPADAGWFGIALDADAGLLAIGAAYARDAAGVAGGAVHLYRAGGDGIWRPAATLRASDRSDSARFGRSLSVSGSRIAVGAPPRAPVAPRRGTVYVFEDDGTGAFVERRRLVAGQPDRERAFGHAVALDGDSLVAADAQRAWVFERDRDGVGTWGLVRELGAGLVDGDEHGIAIDAGRIALAEVDGAGGPGLVRVFERNAGGALAWGPTATLAAPRAARRWGVSLALRGDTLVATSAIDVPGSVPAAVAVGLDEFRLAGTTWNRALGAASAPLGDAATVVDLPIAFEAGQYAIGMRALAGEDPPRPDVGGVLVFALQTELLSDGFE